MGLGASQATSQASVSASENGEIIKEPASQGCGEDQDVLNKHSELLLDVYTCAFHKPACHLVEGIIFFGRADFKCRLHTKAGAGKHFFG